MKTSLSGALALVAILACAAMPRARAQTVTLPEINLPEIRLPAAAFPQGAEAGKLTEEQAAALVAPDDAVEHALRVVATFLELREDQVEDLVALLELRREAVQPLLDGIHERERQIHELLESGGDPVEIGQLVIEIHELYQLIQRAQEDFLAGFEGLLEDEQLHRLRAVHLAARLQPIVPAFQTLHLF